MKERFLEFKKNAVKVADKVFTKILDIPPTYENCSRKFYPFKKL